MSGFLSYFNDAFAVHSAMQSIIVIASVCGAGLLLSKIPTGRFSLGVTWVFFAGIIAAHFGLSIDPIMNSFAQNFGLVLFIYALGLQVGPSFFPSLRSGGIKENLLAIVVAIIGIALCILYYYVLGLPMTDLVGLFSGATTNTPALAAAQSTVASSLQDSAAIESTMALACAVTYPLGVLGMILGMMVLSFFVKNKNKDAKAETKHHPTTAFTEFEVVNPAIEDLSIAELAQRTKCHFVVTRLWHNGSVAIPNSQTKLKLGDRLLIASPEEEGYNALEVLFGKKVDKDWNEEGIDWDSIDNELVSKRIVVTNKEINGKTLGELKLRTIYGVNVSRLDRSGIELFAAPHLHLQLGDRISIVGEGNAVKACEDLLGNEVKMLDAPHLLSLFIGILLGCLLGAIPIFLPGISMPIKLGLAGGPIIMGILVGAYGPRFKMTTYITNSASQLIQKLGLILYLATLGLASGANFVSTIVNGDGLLWLLLGFTITVIPVVLTGWMSMRLFKMKYGSTCGMLCGSMANPMALDFLSGKVSDDSHNVSYATVYPLSMFFRIISAQILILVFIAS